MIEYEATGEWSGYTLAQRPDGLWRYEQWSAYQGSNTGRIVLLQPPQGWTVEDEADLDTRVAPDMSKAEELLGYGREVRCLRRGHLVQ